MDSGFKALVLACLFLLLWDVMASLKYEVIVNWTEFPLWEQQRAKGPVVSFPCSLFPPQSASVVWMSVAPHCTSGLTQCCWGYFFFPSRWMFRLSCFLLLKLQTGIHSFSHMNTAVWMLKKKNLFAFLFYVSSIVRAVCAWHQTCCLLLALFLVCITVEMSCNTVLVFLGA